MKSILLALTLVLSPLSCLVTTAPAAAADVAALGDLAPYRAIVTDTLALTDAGDIAAAQRRITDFETAWDEATLQMRQRDPASWTVIDQAADAALDALRANAPSKDTVEPALTALLASFDPAPAASAAGSPLPAMPTVMASFAVTNPDGSPVPCEVTLQALRDVLTTTAPATADKARFDEVQSKGIDRCNADDDKRADGFFAEALAMLGH